MFEIFYKHLKQLKMLWDYENFSTSFPWDTYWPVLFCAVPDNLQEKMSRQTGEKILNFDNTRLKMQQFFDRLEKVAGENVLTARRST